MKDYTKKVKQIKPRNIYSRLRSRKVFKEKSMTSTEFKDECDVNHIMAQYVRTGSLTHVAENPRFGDFTDVTDYQTALDKVIEVGESFQKIPSDIRSMFKNDPQLMLEFLKDKKNTDKAIELGLAKPKEDKIEKNTTGGKPDDTLENKAKNDDKTTK